MRTLFGTLLGAIAVGIWLVAYGLLSPRVSANAIDPYQYQSARPMFASDRADLAYPNPVSSVRRVQPARAYAYTTAPAPRRAPVASVDGAHRDWVKTAMVIGGSSAAGAGLGGIFAGKKGALIGAAIGGGAASLWEAKH